MILVDKSSFPVVIVTFKKTIENDEEFQDFLKEWLNLYSQEKYFSFIFDTREISEIPSLKYCFQIAAFISRIKSLPVKYLEKSSIIVSNSMIQTLIDLVFSIQTPISDVYIYTSTDVSDLNTIFNRFESNTISDYKLIKCN
jgi:hypothetical protein